MLRNLTTAIFKPLRTTFKSKFAFGDEFTMLKREKEAKMARKLKQSLNPTYLQVTDTTLSGSSCGQMYRITIQSPLFEGKSKVAQHQMVSQILAQELKSIHAFNLKTKVPKKAEQPAGGKDSDQATQQATQAKQQ